MSVISKIRVWFRMRVRVKDSFWVGMAFRVRVWLSINTMEGNGQKYF